MELAYDGLPAIVSTNGTAATEIVNYTPPEGELHEIVDLFIYHDDDGAARDCAVYLVDDDNSTTYELETFAALAHSTTKRMRVDFLKYYSDKLVLSYKFHFRLVVTGIAAGKKGYIRSVVYKARCSSLDWVYN